MMSQSHDSNSFENRHDEDDQLNTKAQLSIVPDHVHPAYLVEAAIFWCQLMFK